MMDRDELDFEISDEEDDKSADEDFSR